MAVFGRTGTGGTRGAAGTAAGRVWRWLTEGRASRFARRARTSVTGASAAMHSGSGTATGCDCAAGVRAGRARKAPSPVRASAASPCRTRPGLRKGGLVQCRQVSARRPASSRQSGPAMERLAACGPSGPWRKPSRPQPRPDRSDQEIERESYG